MLVRRLLPLGILCGTALLGACGAGYDWSHASTLNTITAYQKFLSQYPDNVHAADAKHRIATLQDEHAWTSAQIASSAEGYRQYLAAEPDGAHAKVAREEVRTRERDAAWRTAQTNESAKSLQDFLNQYPSGDEAAEARERLKAIAGYRAQLGTAHSLRLANRERDALSRRFGKDLRPIVVLTPDANDRGYRITSAPMSEQDASRACEALEHAGHFCTVMQRAG